MIKGMFGKKEGTKTTQVVKEVVIKDETKTETNNETKFKIEFITTPSGVEVYDEKGNFLGETPFFVNLPKGFTKFSFEKKGFDKVLKELHVKQDEKIEISMAEKIYNLKINTNISGAKLYIDEKEQGETPFEIKLKEGIYSIKLEKEEYDSYSEEIPLKKDIEKTITLNKNIFEIIINSNVEDSKVYIDGNLKGKTPYTIKLSKGKHKIKLTKDDFGDKEKEFEINKDETISFELYEKGKGGIGEMVIIPNREFKMDATEVTVAQFKECVNAGGCIEKNFETNSNDKYRNVNYGLIGKENHPMNSVSWYGAEEFCKWAGKRLPTEEEWKYAAKGGQNYKYSGSNNEDSVAWYKYNSGNSTHEVATKKANGYGLYDMSGNVWEWTNSWWTNESKSRVMCGNSFTGEGSSLKVDFCIYNSPADFSSNTGFRCVKDEKNFKKNQCKKVADKMISIRNLKSELSTKLIEYCVNRFSEEQINCALKSTTKTDLEKCK